METSKRHVGRPKAAPQTGPLVLSERRTRTKIEVEIHTATAEELGEYVRWVETFEGISTDEASSTTVDFALRTTFKRDRLWQEQRRGRANAQAQYPGQPPDQTPTPSPTRPPSPSRLPPPPGVRPTGDRP